ncbi:alpha/beta fold hydrolase [Streptomyces lincolnensis]|uniref:alpha/beta fold hydrolase n=1 Tax=Streptomyces lincolnensis TaxID=1915 RepID=UPI00082E8FE6|nr:alpha/beta fold hydrolase [Streptomyces lincolnensis]
MRFIFVHGTGVRRERFDDLFRWVCKGLVERFQDADVEPCYWGDTFGTTLSAGGASVPGIATTRGALSDPEAADAAEWLLLLTDPLCELRVLAELGTEDDELGMPGVQSAGESVASSLGKLPRELQRGTDGADELTHLLRDVGLIDSYGEALDEIAASDEFRDACAAAQDDASAAELTTATSRAIVALLLAGAQDMVICTGDERDRIVDLLSSRIGGTARGPVTRVAGMLLKLGLRLTPQSVLDRQRGEFTSDRASEVGDILRYQARGGPLRDRLAQVIGQSPEPPVVIGHSLGGIALVDALALAAVRQQPLSVRLLVTVGSQAPFLHELGALAGLPPGATLPPGFPQWLNIYDRRDLLSYLAEPVFPGDSRVADHEVRSRQPFPVSHSAYWKLDAVYDQIGEALR